MWYHPGVNTTYRLHVGDRGRVVLPAVLREELGLQQGDVLTVAVVDGQMVVSTPRAALARVRSKVRGAGLVSELLDDRRRQAESEQ